MRYFSKHCQFQHRYPICSPVVRYVSLQSVHAAASYEYPTQDYVLPDLDVQHLELQLSRHRKYSKMFGIAFFYSSVLLGD